MGVVGMKVLAAGMLVKDAVATPPELIRYGASFTDTVVIGCSSVAEVRQNFEVGESALPLSAAERMALERRVAEAHREYDYFKARG
jgi:hypothetical protein